MKQQDHTQQNDTQPIQLEMIRMPEPNPPATEQRPTKRRLLFYLIVLACSALYLWAGYQICVDKAQLFRNEMGLTETVARVETIVSDRNDMGQIGGTVYYERVITFWARILSGELFSYHGTDESYRGRDSGIKVYLSNGMGTTI